MAETLRTRGLFLVAPHSLTLVCTRKIANFPVSEPIYTSSLPCFKCIEILLFGSGRFCACPFYVSSLGLLPFHSGMLFAASEPSASALDHPSSLSCGCPSLWFGFFFLRLLPRIPPPAKAALVPACITWGNSEE